MEMADGDRFTPEQAEALSALRDGRNVFLSGNAGTGKSYVLNAFISDLKARNVDFLALAPTGIAALNLTDGSTIHRTLKIAPGVCAPDGPKGSRKVLDAATGNPLLGFVTEMALFAQAPPVVPTNLPPLTRVAPE